eukprot:scaffold1671_cov344-Pavlova_lutheri.AAC.14
MGTLNSAPAPHIASDGSRQTECTSMRVFYLIQKNPSCISTEIQATAQTCWAFISSAKLCPFQHERPSCSGADHVLSCTRRGVQE